MTQANTSSKKKVDPRVRSLLEHCVSRNERAFFVVLGDRGREQLVNLHFMLSKMSAKKQQQVLWCYKKELGFSSHKKSRAKEIKRKIAKGEYDPNIEDPFELFTSATDIRYCYYKDSEQVLGKTHSMLVLQDFEALTPNILCRTVETVAGGGIVVLLLKSMSSLRQLYNVSMDIHQKFSKESDFEPRWNERFLLSLVRCDTCLVVDDELNVLPIAKNKAFVGDWKQQGNLQGVVGQLQNGGEQDASAQQTSGSAASSSLEIAQLQSQNQAELASLKQELKDAQPLGNLLNLARTLEQAQALMQFVDVISEKTLRQTVSLTAGRGRGKSASLGLALASAIAYGYSNIFVTAPSPENLQTVFEFLLKGFDAIGYVEHQDYDVIVQTNNKDGNPSGNNANSSGSSALAGSASGASGSSSRGNVSRTIVRVNVYKEHRQTIQYLPPENVSALGQAELLVIDEAAAIPLPTVKSMLGPYLVLMSSTVNGYEGTGRSLSLKLLQDLKAQKQLSAEILLTEPIRYAFGDSVEAWLNELCLLDASDAVVKTKNGNSSKDKNSSSSSSKKILPMPSECELFLVDRTALFSYHQASEKFLKKMMGLFVASHYKNSPNDLILLSDAPGHYLFVLLGPSENESGEDEIPEILVAIHVASEGALNKEAVAASLARGLRPSGDLISWTISQQFGDANFGSLRGARIVRIATHPSYMRQGYGQEAIRQLIRWTEGEMAPATGYASEEEDEDADVATSSASKKDSNKDEHQLVAKAKIPVLLKEVTETRPVFSLDWLGTSFGVTLGLFEFWRKLGFSPVYVRQTSNDITGEHSAILLRTMQPTSENNMQLVSSGSGKATSATWLREFGTDFRSRMLRLLRSQQLSKWPINVALSVVGQPQGGSSSSSSTSSSSSPIKAAQEQESISNPLVAMIRRCVLPLMTRHDLHRIELFANKRAEAPLIMDLLAPLASLYFEGRLLLAASAQRTSQNIITSAGTTTTTTNISCQPLVLSAAQAAILLAVGLQHKSFDQVGKELGLAVSQVFALFTKAVLRIWSDVISPALEEEAADSATATASKTSATPTTVVEQRIGGSGANKAGGVLVVEANSTKGGAAAIGGEGGLPKFGERVSLKKRKDENKQDGRMEKLKRSKNK
ncbi:unnamed protein product [Amoebophrya sp. A25]|nr:unnamed protein product [Amoebophrya sp. A25]|eukprot:GSA25T00017900001.1